ncbi:MAG: hypothetical protein KDA52_22455, partial [Planctomycetaceae bacterium]|nr:hypothetical protein [Planctomycetaceae bacterium]
MTSLVTPMLWCVLQVTIVALLAAVVYFVIKRVAPSSAGSVLLTGLTLAALLTVTMLSPWPSWRLAQSTETTSPVPPQVVPEPSASFPDDGSDPAA